MTSVKQQATVCQVKLRNFVHKGLKKLYAEDVAKGVPPDTVDKLRKMLAFLDDMQDPEELRANGREVYIYFPNGMGRTKLSWMGIEKALKGTGTGRNWNSVTKMLAIAEEMEAAG